MFTPTLDTTQCKLDAVEQIQWHSNHGTDIQTYFLHVAVVCVTYILRYSSYPRYDCCPCAQYSSTRWGCFFIGQSIMVLETLLVSALAKNEFAQSSLDIQYKMGRLDEHFIKNCRPGDVELWNLHHYTTDKATQHSSRLVPFKINVLLLFIPVRGVCKYNCIYNCIYNWMYHRWLALQIASSDSLYFLL